MWVIGSGVEMKVERRMPMGEDVMVTLMESSMSWVRELVVVWTGP